MRFQVGDGSELEAGRDRRVAGIARAGTRPTGIASTGALFVTILVSPAGGVFIIYLGLVAGTLFPFWLASGSPAVSAVVILTLGGMHVLYDGFIWKRPVPGTGGMLTTITV